MIRKSSSCLLGLFLSAFLVFLGVSTYAQQEVVLIGVLDLEPKNVDAGEVQVISERLRYHIGCCTEVFQLVERYNMVDIVQEQGFQNFSGACSSSDCIVDVGVLLGVSKMMAGSIGRVGSLYTLQVRIINVETARVENQAYANSSGLEELLESGSESVIANIVSKLTGQAIRPQTKRDPEQDIQVPENIVRINIAAFNLDSNNAAEQDVLGISSRLRLMLDRTGVFSVLNQDTVNNILYEVGFKLTGACDTVECIVEVGKILGVGKMVAGSISQVGDLYSIQVRIIDIASGFVEHAAFYDETINEVMLDEAPRLLANELAVHYLPPQ